MKEGWTRNPSGDRPPLSFGKGIHAIPKQLGFLNEFGSEVQVSVDHAIRLGYLHKPTQNGQIILTQTNTYFEAKLRLYKYW